MTGLDGARHAGCRSRWLWLLVLGVVALLILGLVFLAGYFLPEGHVRQAVQTIRDRSADWAQSHPWLYVVIGPGAVATLAGVLVGGAINWYSSRKLESRREEFAGNLQQAKADLAKQLQQQAQTFAASMEQARSTFMQELQDREQRFLSQQEKVRLLQRIKSKLGEHKAEFDRRPDLIEIVELLRKEAKGCSAESLSPETLRNLPGFLEPIGTYLEFHAPSSATPDELSSLYGYFAEEVRLCRQSKWMWSNDDYHTSPFWSSFRRFVAATEKWAP